MATRRFRAVGGVAALQIPVLVTVSMLCAIAAGEWTVVAAIALGGLVLAGLDARTVVEISPVGLTRGFTLRGAFVTPARVLAWRSVAEVTTAWRAPNDFSVLETVVSTHDGARITFSSRMGFAAYRALVAEVTRAAPAARRRGLTDAVLTDPVTGPRARVMVTSAVAGVVLFVVALLMM